MSYQLSLKLTYGLKSKPNSNGKFKKTDNFNKLLTKSSLSKKNVFSLSPKQKNYRKVISFKNKKIITFNKKSMRSPIKMSTLKNSTKWNRPSLKCKVNSASFKLKITSFPTNLMSLNKNKSCPVRQTFSWLQLYQGQMRSVRGQQWEIKNRNHENEEKS